MYLDVNKKRFPRDTSFLLVLKKLFVTKKSISRSQYLQ